MKGVVFMIKEDVKALDADVLVIGGGTAGFGAAVAAARKGLNVYLLESSNKIGGVMASNPGMPLGAAYACDKPIGGIVEEYANRLFNMNPPAAEKRECAIKEFGPEIVYDHEIGIFTLYQMLDEAGVNLLLNSTVIEPIMDGDRIKGVVYFDRNGKHTIYSKVIIDCSGDGDIASKAGVPFQMGDNNGDMMGASMTFFMVDVDWDTVFHDNYDHFFREYAKKGIEAGKIHKDLDNIYVITGFHKNTMYFNSVIIRNVDGSEPLDITKASIEARKRCHELIKFVKEEIPGFEKSRAIYLGPIVGVRETRKFEGLYRITEDDITSSKKYSDGIVACDNPVDDVFRGENGMSHTPVGEVDSYYTIPFRCMVPKKVENLFFAGRIVSSDPVAFASVRGMPQCMAMGQACGVAAAMAIEKNIAVQDVCHDELVKELIEQGVKGIGGQTL